MRLLVVLAALGAVLAGPVVAAVWSPELVTQAAEQGIAVEHHHFRFDTSFTVHDHGRPYEVHVGEGDMYVLPLTTQVVLHGAVAPPPTDDQLREAFRLALERYHVPILSYDVQRGDGDVTVHATLPAGVLAALSPRMREVLERYEQPG
jgi:hypothetical protein